MLRFLDVATDYRWPYSSSTCIKIHTLQIAKFDDPQSSSLLDNLFSLMADLYHSTAAAYHSMDIEVESNNSL